NGPGIYGQAPGSASEHRCLAGAVRPDEPLAAVAFAFDSAPGSKAFATMNPGLSYVAVTWQVAAEAIIPVNGAAGRSVGARAQLLLFLDDLIPAVFGKPLLSH